MSEVVLGEHNKYGKQTELLAAKIAKRLQAAIAGEVDKQEVFKNCLTCKHFIEAMETCNKFGARPPARIIAYGCPDFLETDPFIPF